MTKNFVSCNERSWAIDLIAHLKSLGRAHNRPIKDAGGEQTIKSEGKILFPDVLLFGDSASKTILQGWELKMPDTPIHDPEFRKNAENKANALKLNSFLLWNVSHAHLYIREATSKSFKITHVWDQLKDIKDRAVVSKQKDRWEALAKEIFLYLNDLFDRGELIGLPFIEIYRNEGIVHLLMENIAEVENALKQATKGDEKLRSKITLWWDRYKDEYTTTGAAERERTLAKTIIFNWMGKLLFGNILREKDSRARCIKDISNSTPKEALKIFEELSQSCNFWTIFSSDSLGLDIVPTTTWNQLKEFNNLLVNLRIADLEQNQLSSLLEAILEVNVRKLRGQYVTPVELAKFLVHLCLRDIGHDRILDPCCGSGTIARIALECKLSAGMPNDQAVKLVFAGDQDFQAVQIATFALAKSSFINLPLRIFQKDVFELKPNLSIDFRNPANGEAFTEKIGYFDVIVSNLPFISQKGRKEYENRLSRLLDDICDKNVHFSGRADIAAYIPFVMYPLLEKEGRLGIIMTNAWSGTDWGDDFYNLVNRYYSIEIVITSGSGRWFKNSKVVANIIILKKRICHTEINNKIKFVVLNQPIENIKEEDEIKTLVSQIKLGKALKKDLTIRSISVRELNRFKQLGLARNAQFVDCDWILKVPLIPLKSVFAIRRGERRGCNDLFYPGKNHGIEKEYIHPLAKSSRDFKRLCDKPKQNAFMCGRSLAELEQLGHQGALNWIKPFETKSEKLKLLGQYWYEMKIHKPVELAMFINYNFRLFVARIKPPAFADQRLICLEPKKDRNINLYHALLNSTISMFIIEASGFGRGEGALDINKDSIEAYMHMLDPMYLDSKKINSIERAFYPLLQRDILEVPEELQQPDRHTLDSVILDAYNLKINKEEIYASLLGLIKIRKSVLYDRNRAVSEHKSTIDCM